MMVGVAFGEKTPRAEWAEGKGPCGHPESGSCRPGLSLPPADSVPGRWKTAHGSLLDSDHNNKPHKTSLWLGVCLTQEGACDFEWCLSPSRCRSGEDLPSPSPPPVWHRHSLGPASPRDGLPELLQRPSDFF